MPAFYDIDQVTFPVECSAVRGRAAILRSVVAKHNASMKLREKTINGYLVLVGTITVKRQSYVAARAAMSALLDELMNEHSISRASLSNRF